MTRLLEDGRPIVTHPGDPDRRMGPLARLLLTAVVPDERSSRAERGRLLASEAKIHSVSVAEGVVTARATGSEGREYEVELRTRTLPRRIWHAMSSSHEGARLVLAALEGRPQAVQLEHALTVDWGEPLVPRRDAIRRGCTCPDVDARGACKHVVGLAYVLADAVDRDASLLLEWRGCGEERPAPPSPAEETATRGDPWEAGPVPTIAPPRPLPPGAVVKRLGSSGVIVDDRDLAEVLEAAYAAFGVAPGA